jgi:tetratricopeptide (TPR) repeat protein
MCDAIPGFYGNRAAAHAKLNKHEEAVADCDAAVRIDPTYSKGFGRKGMSLQALGRLDEARKAYTTALDLDPQCVQYKEALAELPPPPSVFAGLFEGNPAMAMMAESMAGNPQVAGLLAGLQGGAAAGAARGPVLLDNLSTTVHTTATCSALILVAWALGVVVPVVPPRLADMATVCLD